MRIKPTVKWKWHKRKSTCVVLSLDGNTASIRINSIGTEVPINNLMIGIRGVTSTTYLSSIY